MKILRYYEGQVYAAKNDYDFCRILVTKLNPLMRILAPGLYNKWDQEKKAYVTTRLELEAKVLTEAIEYFKLLKKRLRKKGLLKEIQIKQHICIIETMLRFGENRSATFVKKSIDPVNERCFKWRKTKSRELYLSSDIKDFEWECLNCHGLEIDHRLYTFPSYVYGVYTEVKNLCLTIIALSMGELVKDRVEIRYRPGTKFVEKKDGNILQGYRCSCGYIYDDKTAKKGANDQFISFDQLSEDFCCPFYKCPMSHFEIYRYPILCNVSHVNSFNFAPSFHELQNLNDLLNKDCENIEDNDIWIAVEMLHRIDWAWNISRDYLRKKTNTLSHKDAKDCARSAFLLGLCNLTAEVNKLEPKRKRNRNALFCDRVHVKENLEKVLHEIYHSSDQTLSKASDIAIPYAIELILEDHNQLRLFVEWMPGVIEVCHIHSFQDSAINIGRSFVADLLDHPGESIKINLSEDLDENAKEYLRRIGIKGVLARLFIREAKADKAIFWPKRRVLEDMPGATLKKLCNSIQKFKTVTWL